LQRNELEKITHLRFDIHDLEGDEDIPHLLNLARSGLNKLKYICIDYVFIGPGLNHPVEENLLEMLECQKETLEYFKLKDSSEDSVGDTDIKLPAFLPNLKVLKLSGNFRYDIDILDLNSRFPNLNELDLTGKHGFYSQFNVWRGENARPLIPCIQIKKLHLDNGSCRDFLGTGIRMTDYFPNVTQVRYHMSYRGTEVCAHSSLWTMTSLEHLVLKVPLYPRDEMFSAILKPFEFISGGTSFGYIRRSPNIRWLPGLKSLKIKQRRRYGCPQEKDENGFRSEYDQIESLGFNILTNMQNLVHFSSDLHCFSDESIAQLKMKIPHFEPGTCVEQVPLFR